MIESALVECVPNISEGRNLAAVRMVERALPVPLLDSTSDPDHNRSVLTFAAAPAEIGPAAFAVIAAACDILDVSSHEGVHPRTGAADVVPFVPVHRSTLAECAEIAHSVGERIWRELRVPVFFYEAAALRSECVRLENVRRSARHLRPDLGDKPHATAGVCIVGARKVLIAWNINLRTEDLAFAREIASSIREAGGGLPAVKALGLPLRERNQVQVSINLVDYERTPLHEVFAAVEKLCRTRAVEIEGSELIGLIPQAALDQSRDHDLHWLNLRPGHILERALNRESALNRNLASS